MFQLQEEQGWGLGRSCRWMRSATSPGEESMRLIKVNTQLSEI